jgi:hypothetical protein
MRKQPLILGALFIIRIKIKEQKENKEQKLRKLKYLVHREV